MLKSVIVLNATGPERDNLQIDEFAEHWLSYNTPFRKTLICRNLRRQV